MQTQIDPARQLARASEQTANELGEHLMQFLTPLLRTLDALLDVRLVRTLSATVQAVIQWRHGTQGLLLSELGGYLLSPDHAPAGTKRLSNLLRSPRWTASVIDEFLWQHADQRVQELGETALVVWDESVLEKPESRHLEGLGPVRSSVAARLVKWRPGYPPPPQGPRITVPGLHWLGLLVLGRQGTPQLAAMRWWTNRGVLASDSRTQEGALLAQCQQWGRRVLHVFDQGFAGEPWLTTLLAVDARFVLRWKKDYHLVDSQGRERAAWQITRGKRSRDRRVVRYKTKEVVQSVYWCAVRHPHLDTLLWLVVSRPGKGQKPWYLLTNEPVTTAEQAWNVVFAYARRWQIELTWRYSKTELAFESPRCRLWETRRKLLMIASLAYAFLLLLLDLPDLCRWLLRAWCHRTGQRSRDRTAPLYRLRAALCRLWLAYPPASLRLPQNSG